jgi:hypothetical protein
MQNTNIAYQYIELHYIESHRITIHHITCFTSCQIKIHLIKQFHSTLIHVKSHCNTSGTKHDITHVKPANSSCHSVTSHHTTLHLLHLNTTLSSCKHLHHVKLNHISDKSHLSRITFPINIFHFSKTAQKIKLM